MLLCMALSCHTRLPELCVTCALIDVDLKNVDLKNVSRAFQGT